MKKTDNKSIITAHEEYDTPNATTIQAIQEVQEMKKNPDAYKSYSNAEEMMRDILEDLF